MADTKEETPMEEDSIEKTEEESVKPAEKATPEKKKETKTVKKAAVNKNPSVFDEPQKNKKVSLEDMTDEQLQAELQRRKEPAKWVSIMDDSDETSIINHLKKLNKVEAFIQRNSEKSRGDGMKRIHVMPLTLTEIADPLIADMMKNCMKSTMHLITEPDKEPYGDLILTFRKKVDLDNALEELSTFKEGLKIFPDDPRNIWMKEWADMRKEFAYVYSLFVPSLPDTMTEKILWEMFPHSVNICLIEAVPRKHAYVYFTSKDDAKTDIDAQNEKGPISEDIKFCGMLSFEKMDEITNKGRGKQFRNEQGIRSGDNSGQRGRGRGRGERGGRGRGDRGGRGFNQRPMKQPGYRGSQWEPVNRNQGPDQRFKDTIALQIEAERLKRELSNRLLSTGGFPRGGGRYGGYNDSY